MAISSEKEKQELFLALAQKHFGMNSLKTKGLKPFGDLANARWAIKGALLEAFNAGVMAGLQQAKKIVPNGKRHGKKA